MEVGKIKEKDCSHPNKTIEDVEGFMYFVCPDCGDHSRIDEQDLGE